MRRNLVLVLTVLCSLVLPLVTLVHMTLAADLALGDLVFRSNFELDELGRPPAGWTVWRQTGVQGFIEVVEDPTIDSGRAVRIRVEPMAGGSLKLSMSARRFGAAAASAHIIMFEYKVKWVEGQKGLYTYVTSEGSQHRMILHPGNNNLAWHITGNTMRVGPLADGWNHVRVIADRNKGTADIYVNDMGTPIVTDAPFQRPVDSWEDIYITLMHETVPSEAREAYYADLQVWTVESYSRPGQTAEREEVVVVSDTSITHWLPPRAAEKPSLELQVSNGKEWRGLLRPSEGTRAVHSSFGSSLPFYQAVPVAQGVLYPSQVGLVMYGMQTENGSTIPAVVRPSALWPDGSVRWLAVDGVWPGDVDLSESEALQLAAPGQQVRQLDSVSHVAYLGIEDGVIYLFNARGERAASLTPKASYIEITEPKVILPDTMPDDERQYEWAQPLGALNPQAVPAPLAPRILESVVEDENEVYTIYRLRGDGGPGEPASRLEWQLRVRIYHHIPLVRLQMSWGLHWDPNRYALTQAEWTANFVKPFTTGTHAGTGSQVDLSTETMHVTATPRGVSTVRLEEAVLEENASPDAPWDVVTVTDGSVFLGVGTVNMRRLGPNRLTLGADSITWASWDAVSGYGLDLRLTTEPHEFQLDMVDSDSVAIGVMRTLETSLVWAGSAAEAEQLALLEAKRDYLWFPSRSDLVATGAIGPWADYAFESNRAYFDDVLANIYFVLASRDRWRWYGWANYGDVRTNFAVTSDPDRGLHADRWALHGRYGWRNGSTEAYHGFWLTGLAFEDREVLMAALDYALHVVDVDVAHRSFFGIERAESGGMHRRNKDHWSGSVQMQYTPSMGLYLTRWLTGHERVSETLEEIRAYSLRQAGTSSIYAASAWINRYMETHDPADLEIALDLLYSSARAWEQAGPPREEHLWGNLAPGVQLTGLNALYKNNFRLPTNGIPVLIDFYEATHDRLYLDTIKTIMQAHGVPAGTNSSLGNYFGLAYLLAAGYTEDEVGIDLVARSRDQVMLLVHRAETLAGKGAFDRSQWNYDILRTIAGDTETTEVGWRATYSPVVLRYFGNLPVSIDPVSPRASQAVSGVIPVELRLRDPARSDSIERISVQLNGETIYTGTEPPGGDVVQLDTTKLAEGTHTLSWNVAVKGHGEYRQSISFRVNNLWTLTENMAPPTTGGWFGTIDHLQAKLRSEGWDYETGSSALFFGDPQRLVRKGATTEYLIWETPRLVSVDMTIFVRPDTEWEGAILLAASPDGENWLPMPYESETEAGTEWNRVKLHASVDEPASRHWFRLTVTDAVAKDVLQIGDVVLRGYRE